MFSEKHFIYTSDIPMHAACLVYFIFLHFISIIIFDEEHKNTETHNYEVSFVPPVTSVLLGPNIPFKTFYLWQCIPAQCLTGHCSLNLPGSMPETSTSRHSNYCAWVGGWLVKEKDYDLRTRPLSLAWTSFLKYSRPIHSPTIWLRDVLVYKSCSKHSFITVQNCM